MWTQRDALNVQSGPLVRSQSPTCDQGAEAYKHVKLVVNDIRRDFDLHDLLISTRREETYQPYPQGVRRGLRTPPDLLKSLWEWARATLANAL